MKKLNILAPAITLLLLVVVFALITKVKTRASSETVDPALIIDIKPSKERYILGEIVKLNIDITNNGESDVVLHGASAQSGFLKIFIGKESKDFKKYSNSRWISGPTPGFTLRPGQTISSTADLLWNFKPEVSGLSSVGIRQVTADRILTDYAFEEPGIYQIKAVLVVSGESQETKDSDAIQIIIDNPTGPDLEVWNRIRENGEMAYFIQHGSPRVNKDEEKERFMTEMDNLVRSYPGSLLGNEINESLEKYRKSMKEKKVFLDKLKK